MAIRGAAAIGNRGILSTKARGARWSAFLPRVLILAVLATAAFSAYTKYQRYAGCATLTDSDMALEPVGSAAAPSSDPGEPQEAMLRLFGMAAPKPAARPKVPDAPPTSLKLRLLAVMASDEQQRGLAIIAEPGGKEQGYRVGETIPGDANLDQVLADRVIISRNGRQETLLLMDGKSLVGGKLGAPGCKIAQERAQGAVGEGGDSRVLPELARYQVALASNPDSVAGLVRFRAVREGETLRGYRVFPGRNPNLLGRAGLRVGDIITSANGIALNSEEAGRAVLAELPNACGLELEVLRDGKVRAMSLATR